MINNQILGFNGDYRFLSNFDEHDGCEIIIDGVLSGQKFKCKNVETAYQALKTFDATERYNIATAESAGKAKRLGKTATLRSDWDRVKLDLMYQLLLQKFSHPYYKNLLLQTNDAILVEVNNWGDTFWGVCNNEGLNWLGILLMQVREFYAK